MPSEISNALGTQRQYTPRPESGYQGRYHGVEAGRVYYDPYSKDMSLARNMEKLASAFDRWEIGHERRKEALGLQRATDLVEIMTPDDMKTLGTIDAAQQYGYADEAANPYFRAYVDKLRGKALSHVMRAEYDNKYMNEPAKNMDEEAKRYMDFSEEFTKGIEDKVDNIRAFKAGYAEKSLDNISQLWSNWQAKKRDEDIRLAITEAVNQGSDIIKNAPTILQESGGDVSLITRGMQSIFNTLALSGAPFEARQKFASDWAIQMAQTGHMTDEQIGAVLENVVAQTLISGETIPLSQLVNLQTIKSAAAEFNAKFRTVADYQMIQKYINEENPEGFYAHLEELRQIDPEEAARQAPWGRQIESGAHAHKTARENEEKQRLKEQRSAMEKALKEQQKQTNANNMVNVWMAGGNSMLDPDSGMLVPVNGMDVDKKYLRAPLMNKFLGAVQNGDLDKALRALMLNNPAAKEIVSSVASDMAYNLAIVNLDNLDNKPELVEKIRPFLNFYSAKAGYLETIFGEAASKDARLLSSLRDLYGGEVPDDETLDKNILDKALRAYATYKATDSDVRNGYESKAKEIIKDSVFTLGYVQGLTGGMSELLLDDRPDIKADVVKMATVLMAQGQNPEDAVQAAGNMYQDAFFEWRGAMIPKTALVALTAYGGIDEDGSRAAMSAALEKFAGDYPDVNYDRRSQEFVFGRSGQHVSLKNIVKLAREIADIQEEQELPEPMRQRNVEELTEQVNEQRADDFKLVEENQTANDMKLATPLILPESIDVGGMFNGGLANISSEDRIPTMSEMNDLIE